MLSCQYFSLSTEFNPAFFCFQWWICNIKNFWPDRWNRFDVNWMQTEHDHLLSTHLLSTHLLSASLDIPSFAINSLAINSLAICFTCYLFHLLSASLALRPHLLSPPLLSGQFAIRPHLLSKRLLSSLNCYQCSSAIQNELLSKYVAIKISCVSKKKLLSKPVLSCYHKLVAF